MRRFLHIAIFGALLFRVLAGAAPDPAPFNKTVQPVLREKCATCHNEKLASGGLNIGPFLDAGSVAAHRDGWERILAKLKTGEMPPKGTPRPSAEQMDALMKYVQGEFDRADRAIKPDPGRVTARRLNRAEYANTIRDLLGVNFRAQEEFPADDSGYGFDNIGDVLTISPALMQIYFSAAEKIASRAVGGDPLPKPGLFGKRIRSLQLQQEVGSIQYSDHFEFDADYIVRTWVAGHRGAEGKPVTLVISVDDKPVRTLTIDTRETEATRASKETQRLKQEIRVILAEGTHTFRATFAGDEIPKSMTVADRTDPAKNIRPETMEILGPFPSKEDRPSRKKILTCDPASGAACVNRILSTLSRRAYRRPVTKAETAELVNVFERAKGSGYTPDQSLQFAIQAMLVSPHFLFRMERDPRPGVVGRISDIELASRLSYFLWSSIPDDELLHFAEIGRLHNPVVLEAQMKRMVADPKSAALADNFAGQWLETRSLDAAKPDPKKFPEWTPALRQAMKTETRMFFEAVMRENLPVSDFLNGKYTFLNELLAKHYGIEGVKGQEFRRLELATDQRSGVLTQASVLTVSSYPSRTSPVLRGKYVLENILGTPPPPPPADVPALDETAVGKKGSLRQQFEQHRSNAVCASCHSRMDVLGFGLENYNAIGQWRTQDGNFPVDASGTFPNGKTFSTPAEMKTLLGAELPEFTRTLTEKMLTYALGRGVERFDRRTVQEIARKTAESDYRFQTLIAGIVRSAPFQQRRGEAKPAPKDATTEAQKEIKEIAHK